MSTIPYKKELLTRLLQQAKQKEGKAKKISEDTQARASSEEGAMQSRYSTFKEEGQYLAGGLRGIHEDLKAEVSIIQSLMHEKMHENDRVETFSIVEVEFEDGTTDKFFILPAMGGEKIDDLTVINPTAPIAKALFRKEAGDNFTLRIGDKVKMGEISNVQ